MPIRSPVLRGVSAGTAATVPMTVFLVLMERFGPQQGQPPRMTIDHLLPGLSDRAADSVTLVAHLGFGAVTGAAASAASERSVRAPGATGVATGLVVWALAYELGMPVLGVLPPAHRDLPGRVLTMVGAHVVFGFVLGRLLWRRREVRPAPAAPRPRRRPAAAARR